MTTKFTLGPSNTSIKQPVKQKAKDEKNETIKAAKNNHLLKQY